MSNEVASQTFFASPLFAVVGASTNTEKAGYKVFAWYVKHDLSVTPINPVSPSITAADKDFQTLPALSALPRPKETSVSIITPPAVTLKVLKEAKDLGIPAVWLQPGTFDKDVIEFAQSGGAFKAVVAGDATSPWCILTEGEKALKGSEKL